MNMEITKRYLTEKEAAIYIGMSRSYLRQGRMHKTRLEPTLCPPYIRLGRTIRYVQQDLDQWILRHRVANSIEPSKN